MAQQADTPVQPGQVVRTVNFQPETLVLTFNHGVSLRTIWWVKWLQILFNNVNMQSAAQAKEAQDEQLKVWSLLFCGMLFAWSPTFSEQGFESAERYYHIATPIQKNSCVMYRFQLKGMTFDFP